MNEYIGDWRITRRIIPGQFVTEIIIRNEFNEVIANVYGKNNDSSLISSAPNLLEALEELLKQVDLDKINEETKEKAIKAINKAKKPFRYGGQDIELVN